LENRAKEETREETTREGNERTIFPGGRREEKSVWLASLEALLPSADVT